MLDKYRQIKNLEGLLEYKGKLNNLLAEISIYGFTIEQHYTYGYALARVMRKDIVNRYNLSKGEFTHYYRLTRGRLDK